MLNTITITELNKTPKDYKVSMRKHIDVIKKYHGLEQATQTADALTRLGYNISRDCMILRNGALEPVCII